MNAYATSLSPISPSTPAAECPLNDGVSGVDQLLAAITRGSNAAALDVALDFRLLLAGSTDADTLLREFYRLRAVVEEEHYLACYRLRRWLQTQIVAQVKLDRTQPTLRTSINLGAASYRELCARCAFEAAAGEPISAWVRVTFMPSDSALAVVG